LMTADGVAVYFAATHTDMNGIDNLGMR
jgi:hypothetical protein